MSASTKLMLRTAVIALGIVLIVGLLLSSIGTSEKANAMNPTEWATVADAIDTYIGNQYVPADDGEAGFLMTGTTLKSKIDSNNDGTILGEGDDAADAPVLIDIYSPFATFIPGTSYRLVGSFTTAADATNAPAVAGKVSDHRAAGFSTDIVSYCVTGHTESPAAMGYGAMSAAGYFGSPNPVSVDLKWGRLGWGGAAGNPAYGNTKSYTPNLAAPTPGPLATTTACAGVTPASELVRCAADNALMTYGWVSAWDAVDDPLYQVVDLRSTINNTIADQTTGGAYAIQNPLQTLFNPTGGTWDNLAKLDSSGAKNIVFVNRTQHTVGMAMQGARMLGYDANYFTWSLPMWNNATPPAWPEQFDLATRGYDYPMASGTVDTTAPTITAGPAATPSCGGATITWTTSEPATSRVEWSTTAGGPYTTVNDTVLHSAHSVNLVGLPDGTTIYYKVSSYDGNANGVTSAEGSFATPASGQPGLSLTKGAVYWASVADYNAGTLSVDFQIGNTGPDASNAVIVGTVNTGGVTSSNTPTASQSIASGGSAAYTVTYTIPTSVTNFSTTVYMTADDPCGNGYAYPGAYPGP